MDTAISKRTKVDSTEDGRHQNIARATFALDALAAAGQTGLRLTDVTRITGLSKTVAHRCLAGLVAHSLAVYEPDNGRFFLGDRILAWVTQAQERFDLAERVKPHLRRLADKLTDTIYFLVRRGDEAICYGRAEGSFPIKTLTLNVGDRRPLGVGSGPLGIAAFLPDTEVERLIAQHSAAREKFRFSDDMLRSEIAQARKVGYSHMEGHLIKGMSGVGVPIRNESGIPVASMTVAAITPRLEPPRRLEVVARLKSEAALLETELRLLLGKL
jgi:DNA-binding IclR family transcriptional regulator